MYLKSTITKIYMNYPWTSSESHFCLTLLQLSPHYAVLRNATSHLIADNCLDCLAADLYNDAFPLTPPGLQARTSE